MADYYDEGDASPAQAQDAGTDGAQGDQDAAPAQSTIIPKDFFGGNCKVGDVESVRIDKILEDGYLVSPASSSEEESEEGETAPDQETPSDAMME